MTNIYTVASPLPTQRCALSSTPTLPGPHQLKITIRDSDIPGNPFTVSVLPSPEMRGVAQYTIPGVNKPCGVTVSKSGELVVSEHHINCISVYSREREKTYFSVYRSRERSREKTLSFGSQGSSLEQFQHPHGVAACISSLSPSHPLSTFLTCFLAWAHSGRLPACTCMHYTGNQFLPTNCNLQLYNNNSATYNYNYATIMMQIYCLLVQYVIVIVAPLLLHCYVQ